MCVECGPEDHELENCPQNSKSKLQLTNLVRVIPDEEV